MYQTLGDTGDVMDAIRDAALDAGRFLVSPVWFAASKAASAAAALTAPPGASYSNEGRNYPAAPPVTSASYSNEGRNYRVPATVAARSAQPGVSPLLIVGGIGLGAVLLLTVLRK
jgi:hypothetical protein